MAYARCTFCFLFRLSYWLKRQSKVRVTFEREVGLVSFERPHAFG